MNKRILIPLVVLIVAGVLCSGIVTAQSSHGIQASTKLTRRIFRGVGDTEIPWNYIYIYNPTWKVVSVSSIDLDVSVGGVTWHSRTLTPENYPPEQWDTQVLPFERSVILWHGWIVAEGEPEGTNVLKITIHATVDGEDLELETETVFRVFL